MAFFSQLSKPFSSSLHAKDDTTREAAVLATHALATKCSDPEAVKELIRSLFAVLAGSEGKLTVNSHKCSLLQAIGLISKCAVTGNAMQNLCAVVFEASIKVRKLEGPLYFNLIYREIASNCRF